MKLSIVIPIYNEERTLADIVALVLATPHEKEVLLVNDASRDGTAKIMEELAAAHPEIRCFHHDVNRGKGGALATGFKEVRNDVVIIQDADLEYDPADYAALLAPIEAGKADVVYGSRFLGGKYVRVHMFWHYVGNRLLTLASNIFTNLNLTDMETCYKVMTLDVVRRLDIQSRSFAVEPEMTAKIAKMRVRVYEVPISYSGRDYDEGKKIGLKDAFIAVWAILVWRVMA